jgi:predicted DNA-binding protein
VVKPHLRDLQGYPVAFWRIAGDFTRRLFEGAFDMTALTVRLPDEKHRRLKALAKSRGTPLNRLIDDMTTVMLAEFDAETRFQLYAARGTGQEAMGLKLLDKAMVS